MLHDGKLERFDVSVSRKLPAERVGDIIPASMADINLRVFEATLHQCVERHRRVFIVTQLVFGLITLGFAFSVLRLTAAVAAFFVAPLVALADVPPTRGVPWPVQALLVVTGRLAAAFSHVAVGPAFEVLGASSTAAQLTTYSVSNGASNGGSSGVHNAIAQTTTRPQTVVESFEIVIVQAQSTGMWLLVLVCIHALKKAIALNSPQEYIAGMNNALRGTFGYEYDPYSDRLIRCSAAPSASHPQSPT